MKRSASYGVRSLGDFEYNGFEVVEGEIADAVYVGEGDLFERAADLFMKGNENRETFTKSNTGLMREIEGLEEKIEGMVEPFFDDEDLSFALVCAADTGDMWLRYDVVDVDSFMSDGRGYPSLAMETARDAMKSGAGAYRVLLTDKEFGDYEGDLNPRGLGHVTVSERLPEEDSGVAYKLVYAGDLEICERVRELVSEIGRREFLKKGLYDVRVSYTSDTLALYKEIEGLTGLNSLSWVERMMEM